jgi:hypothetical protein
MDKREMPIVFQGQRSRLYHFAIKLCRHHIEQNTNDQHDERKIPVGSSPELLFNIMGLPILKPLHQ